MGGAGPPVAPPGLRGNACDAIAEASFPLIPFLRLLRSPCLDPHPVLFLSPPPWWIPHNPPRDLPPRRLLFLFALVSFLPLTFHHIQLLSRIIALELLWSTDYWSAPPIIYPSLPLRAAIFALLLHETRFIHPKLDLDTIPGNVTEGCDLVDLHISILLT